MPASSLPDAAALHLSARGLACRRGQRMLFDALDFELRAGELLWVRGRNGSGKTSLLRLVAGLSTPAAGELRRRGPRPVFIGHTNALKDELTAAEALAFLLQLDGHAADGEAVQAALDGVGMGAWRDAAVRALSQGQRRRVALARLVPQRPPGLWLLDEPFDALDGDAGDTLTGLLQLHCARGGSVLLTGHQGVDTRRLPLRELDLDRLH